MNIKDLVKVRLSSRDDHAMEPLRPLLNAWTKAVLHYCRLQDFDSNPWYFNERSSISTLAGAAWTVPGWAALEEFSTKKRGGSEESEGERNGRCDLYVCSRSRHFAFEAKQAWQGITRTDSRAQIEHYLKDAWRDAGDLDIEEGDMRLAATFVVPTISIAKKDLDAAGIRAFVESWLDSEKFAFNRRKPDALAYVFPGKGGGFKGINGLLHPGVVLVIYRRKRGNTGVKKDSRSGTSRNVAS